LRARASECVGAELLLAELADLEVELELLRRSRRVREEDLVGREEPRPFLGLPINGYEGPSGSEVLWIDREDALVRLGGLLGDAEAAPREPGDTLEDGELGLDGGGAVDERVEDLDEVVPGVHRAEELLEGGEVALLRVEVAEDPHRLAVAGLEAQDLAEALGGLGRRLELVGVQCAELLEDGGRRPVGRIAVDVLDLPVVDLGEREVALLLVVEEREGGERLGIPRTALGAALRRRPQL